MILETIELRHVGPFRERARLGPLTAGLNILAAANEAGKTSVLRAAARALFDRHTCRDEEIRALQPAGTSLAPAVEVAFQCDGRQYRIEKVFLHAPQSRLSEWTGGGWQLVAEGDQADQRLQTLLQSKFPGRGATTTAHWGLLGYLWARQGEPATWPSWDGDAGQTIQRRLARVEMDPVIDRLRSSLWATYCEDFTPTGQTRAGGKLKRLEDELMAVDASLREIAEKRERAERLESDFSRLSAEVVRLEYEHRQLREEANRIREAANQAEVLRTELDARQNELESVRTRLKTANADLEALARARAALATARADLAEARKAANEQRRIELELGNRLQEMERTLAGADASLTRLHADRQRIQDLLKLRQLRRDAEELEKQGKRVVKQANERKRLEKLKAGTPDLSPARLRKLEDLADSIREKQTQLQALGLSVELAPSNAAKITVVEGGAKQSLSVGKGDIETLKAPQALELQLHDWGRISIRSGATELKSLAGELAGAEGRLRAALLEAGIASLDEARNVVAIRKDLEHQIRSSESLLTELLGNFESLDQLQGAAGAARLKVEAMLKTVRPAAAEEKSSATDLETRDEELRIKIRSQESLRDQLAEGLREQKGKVKRASDDRQTADKQAAAGAASLQGLESQISAFQQRYPKGVEQAKEQAGQAFVEAEARLKATRQRLPADFEKLPERNRRAASALQEVEDDLNAKRNSYQKVKGSLEVLGAEGLYGKETQLVEKQSVALAQRDLARDRGWAARLAHDLLERRKQAATRAVLAPLEARLTSSFAEVTADGSRRVFLDENLQIRGVGATPDALVPYDHLSQGAKEQLLLCLRLAVAEELSAEEPHTLILDDVLVNTDSVRQQRVLDLLQATARKFQVLVVSCHPERYRGVGQIVQIQR